MDVREHPCLAVPNSLTHEVHRWVHTMALEMNFQNTPVLLKTFLHPSPPAVPPHSGSALQVPKTSSPELGSAWRRWWRSSSRCFQKNHCSLSGRSELQESLCTRIGHLHFQQIPTARAQKS